MSSTDNTLNINTENIATATGTATAAQASSAPALIVPPTPGGPSLLDAATVGMTTAIEEMIKTSAGRDAIAVTKQATALTESPPVIVQQDHQAADEITAAAATIPEFPMPAAAAATDGQVRTV